VGLATSDAPEGTGMDALLVGRLAADPTSGCLWLVPVGESGEDSEDRGEDSEDRVSVIWPKGFAARREPFRVYRPNGELVASEGDVLHTAGGFIAEAPETSVQGLERCRVGAQVWLLGSVDKVDRAAP
jgi:hypothetical protein